MKDALFFNKVAAAILTGGLLFYAAMFAGEILYHPDRLAENAVPIEVEGAETAVAEAEEPAGPEPILGLMAAADPANGETLARRCAACHTFDEGGANRVGPNLWNVVGGPKAHIDGFGYSNALASMEGEWGYSELNGFLANPKEYLPGTSMNFAGIRGAGDRADLIAYLRSLSNDPVPLPTPEEIAAEAGEDVSDAAGAVEDAVDEAAAAMDAAADTAAAVAGQAAAAVQEAAAEAGAAATETAAAIDRAASQAAQTAADAVENATEAVEEAAAQAGDAAGAALDQAADATADATGTAAGADFTELLPGLEAIGPLMAAADPAVGERLARRCAACHTFDEGGANRVGPNLWNVLGGPKAHLDNYNYSDALAGMEGEWGYEEMNALLADPRGYIPGTKMSFAGLRSPEDRAHLIAYLRTLSNDPIALP